MPIAAARIIILALVTPAIDTTATAKSRIFIRISIVITAASAIIIPIITVMLVITSILIKSFMLIVAMMLMLIVIMNEAAHFPMEQSIQGKQTVGHNYYSEITSSLQIVINSGVSMIHYTAATTAIAKSTICFVSITTVITTAAILITIISARSSIPLPISSLIKTTMITAIHLVRLMTILMDALNENSTIHHHSHLLLHRRHCLLLHHLHLHYLYSR